MFKIISKAIYNNLVNEAKAYQDMYDQLETSSMIHEKDNDLKLQKIHDMLIDIIKQSNSKTKKETIYKKIKNVIKFIEKGHLDNE